MNAKRWTLAGDLVVAACAVVIAVLMLLGHFSKWDVVWPLLVCFNLLARRTG